MPRKQPKKETDSSTIEIPIARSDSLRCAAQHFGPWAIEPKFFKSAMDAIRAGTLKPDHKAFDLGDDDDDSDEPGYTVRDGVAIICIDGQMTKRGSSFGGCSTIQVRQALRDAANDWMVKSIVMHVCTPGGTVAGTSDLADEVNAARTKKPVYGYVSDMACSAGYWVVSQCETIYANTTAMIGCIGTYTVLEDDTAMQEQIGVKYRVVSTGEYKGLGADGAVSDKLVADVQREVNELNVPFLAAVSAGRGKKIADIATVSDGRAHAATQALQLGLIDEIASFDAAITAISAENKVFSKESKTMNNTESFKAYAAEHPELVAGYIDQGKKAGISQAQGEEKQRAIAVFSAFGMSDHPAAKSFVAGHDADTAKQIADAAENARKEAAATAKTQADALVAKDAEIEKLRGQVAFVSGGQGAIGTSAATKEAGKADKEAPVKPDENAPKAELETWAKATAEFEWDNEPEKCKGYSAKGNFVAIRSRELTGQHRILAK